MDLMVHGDVQIKRIKKLPTDLVDLKTDIIQEGEATGHAHRLHGQSFLILQNPKTKQKYLRIVEPVALRHEEHREINIPPGEYEVGQTKEFSYEDMESRSVID